MFKDEAEMLRIAAERTCMLHAATSVYSKAEKLAKIYI